MGEEAVIVVVVVVETAMEVDAEEEEAHEVLSPLYLFIYPTPSRQLWLNFVY